MTSTRFFGVLGLVVVAAGCAPPSILVGQRYSGINRDGEHLAQYTIRSNGVSTESAGAMYDLSVRLCDQADDGSTSNCQDNLILENVVPRSVY